MSCLLSRVFWGCGVFWTMEGGDLLMIVVEEVGRDDEIGGGGRHGVFM